MSKTYPPRYDGGPLAAVDKIGGTITISRIEGGNGPGCIRVAIRDPRGRATVAIDLTPADFAMAVTGMGCVHGALSSRDANRIGLQRVACPREKVVPIPGATLEQCRQWLTEHAQEPGMTLDLYLGSQGSIRPTEGGQICRYAAHYYTLPEAAPTKE